MSPETDSEYEALLQFMYLAPVGLVQAGMDGEIVMINPISAQLLMPLSPDGNLNNLLTALEAVAPDLRQRVTSFAPAHGRICDGLRVQLGAGGAGTGVPQTVAITLLKLDDRRLMAVLIDITQQVRRELLLRQNEVCFNAIVTGVHDYALIRLDRRGRIDDWNASIGRVTGFDRAAVIGRSCAIFDPGDASTPDLVQSRLHDADSNGWSLDEGWRVRADGSRFWGSALIAPLHDRNGIGASEPMAEDEVAYCLIVRDSTDNREAGDRDRTTGLDVSVRGQMHG